MIDIIIPVYNNISYTKLFISSLLDQKEADYHLIVINNGSTDETEAFLKGVGSKGMTVINNNENLGYVKAVNQGLKGSTNKYILLSNNDTILSRNLLYTMCKAMGEYDIIAPYTNRTKGGDTNPLLIEYNATPEINEINSFAEKLFEKYAMSIIDTDYVFGHCMMFSRKLFDGVGYLDESFGIGNYDDIDFCKRAKEQGFKIGLLQGGFVYHFCHATFKDLGIDINSLLGFNKKIFDKKWS